MTSKEVELGSDETIMVLRFWAHGMDILQKFTEEQLKAVPGLREAIDAALPLPAAIGWDDESINST